MNSFLATFSFVSFFSWTGPQTNIAKQQDENNMSDSRNNTDLVRFNTHTYLSYNCILEGGGGGVLFPTRYICKKWQSSQQMGDMQPRLEWGISRHAHARKKVTVVSSGCGWNAGSQTYPIRRVLYVGGLCYRQVWSGHHQYKPLPTRWDNNISQGEWKQPFKILAHEARWISKWMSGWWVRAMY